MWHCRYQLLGGTWSTCILSRRCLLTISSWGRWGTTPATIVWTPWEGKVAKRWRRESTKKYIFNKLTTGGNELLPRIGWKSGVCLHQEAAGIHFHQFQAVSKCFYIWLASTFVLSQVMSDDNCLDAAGADGPVKLVRCHGMGGNQAWVYNKMDK